jgi:hypothetical protein
MYEKLQLDDLDATALRSARPIGYSVANVINRRRR